MMTLLGTVLLASLAGSLHCAGMCGGLVGLYAGCGATRCAPDHLAHALYSGGRLLAYVTLGLGAGALGAALDLGGGMAGVQRVSAFAAGAVLVLWAVLWLLPWSPRWSAALPALLGQRAVRLAGRLRAASPRSRALGTGLISGALPCGWLYLFVVAAAGSGSMLGGAAIMAAFWIGTVPVMLGMGYGFGATAARLRGRWRPLAAAVVVALGVATILGRAELSAPAPPVAATSVERIEELSGAGAPCCDEHD